jgi:hypothetical protein
MRTTRPGRLKGFAVILCTVIGMQLVFALPALAASSWNQVSAHCFPRKITGGSYIDACRRMFKLTNDGDTAKDYFQLQFYATGGQWTGFDQLTALGLLVQPKTAPAQAWVDWSPRSDWSGGSCSTTNVGISYGASLSFSVQRCPETWDITKYATAGKFSEWWYDLGGTGQDREVAFSVVVKVNQGTTPSWNFFSCSTVGNNCSATAA